MIVAPVQESASRSSHLQCCSRESAARRVPVVVCDTVRSMQLSTDRKYISFKVDRGGENHSLRAYDLSALPTITRMHY